jgi:hypothetical protein
MLLNRINEVCWGRTTRPKLITLMGQASRGQLASWGARKGAIVFIFATKNQA